MAKLQALHYTHLIIALRTVIASQYPIGSDSACRILINFLIASALYVGISIQPNFTLVSYMCSVLNLGAGSSNKRSFGHQAEQLPADVRGSNLRDLIYRLKSAGCLGHYQLK